MAHLAKFVELSEINNVLLRIQEDIKKGKAVQADTKKAAAVASVPSGAASGGASSAGAGSNQVTILVPYTDGNGNLILDAQGFAPLVTKTVLEAK